MLRFSTWKVAVILGICGLGALLALPNLFPRDEYGAAAELAAAPADQPGT